MLHMTMSIVSSLCWGCMIWNYLVNESCNVSSIEVVSGPVWFNTWWIQINFEIKVSVLLGGGRLGADILGFRDHMSE